MIFYSDPTILIRNLAETDVDVLASGELAQGWGDTAEKYRMRLRDQAEGRCTALAAEYCGQTAGYIHLYRQAKHGPFAGKNWPEIVDFGVLEKFRRHGIGGKLMDAAEELAGQTSSIVTIGVGLHSGYGSAQRMYVQRGYVPDGSGVWYQDVLCPPYADCRNDDGLVLYLSKNSGKTERKTEMNYTMIDMASYKRRSHFAYFSGMANPYVGITSNVDITGLLAVIKAKKLPFFLTVCYCIVRAANGVPEFRQRIVDGKIIQFDQCRSSHTVALEDGTYCYCTLEADLPYDSYIVAGRQAQEAAKQQATITEDAEEILDKYFISSLPGVSYTALVQPTPYPADSNPRITIGKYFQQEGRTLLPVSVLCNHALVDGAHIAAFYQNLAQEIDTVRQNKVLS